MKQVLSEPRRAPDSEGSVLVIDGGASLGSALVGDLIAGLAADNGWSGLIIAGAIRDSDAINLLPIGIKALGTNPRRSAKKGEGDRDVPVRIGNVIIRPGALIHSDADGILVERFVSRGD